MNIYYTAKDIEELSAKGVRELELGPNTSLTDFAKETAEQLDFILIDKSNQSDPVKPPVVSHSSVVVSSQAYNKPRGCQHKHQALTAKQVQVSNPVGNHPQEEAPVNRLVDLMGKIIKRGE